MRKHEILTFFTYFAAPIRCCHHSTGGETMIGRYTAPYLSQENLGELHLLWYSNYYW